MWLGVDVLSHDMEIVLTATANWCCIASSTAIKGEIWRMYAKSWRACCWNANRRQNLARRHAPREAASDGDWSKKAVNRRKSRTADRPDGTTESRWQGNVNPSLENTRWYTQGSVSDHDRFLLDYRSNRNWVRPESGELPRRNDKPSQL